MWVRRGVFLLVGLCLIACNDKSKADLGPAKDLVGADKAAPPDRGLPDAAKADAPRPDAAKGDGPKTDAKKADAKADATKTDAKLDGKVAADKYVADFFPVGKDAGVKSYGAFCNVKTLPCPEHYLICVRLDPLNDNGYCSVRCPKLGALCPLGPDGYQNAVVCNLSTEQPGEFACGFLCKTNLGQTFKCPAALTCSPTDIPPGSGQRPCLP